MSYNILYNLMWTTLEHQGVSLADPYKPHGKSIQHNGKSFSFCSIAEEMIESVIHKVQFHNDNIFYRNFHKCIRKYLPNELKHIDLRTISFKHFPKHTYSFSKKHNSMRINGQTYCISGSYIEPPHVFIGRGEHPLRGTFKFPIQEKDVTMNMSKIYFYKFRMTDYNLIENKDVNWYACWKDPIRNEYKYLFLPKSFVSNDKEKFELARFLKKKINYILNKNKTYLSSDNPKYQQCALALYLIYKLCIRVGNEKNTDIENDTIGCCSLKREHVSFLKSNKVSFKFMGKDSIPFNKMIILNSIYHDKLLHFYNHTKNNLFSDINPSILNRYLNKMLPNLTAKVFRTMKASSIFQSYLGTDIQSFRIANNKAANICNHTNNLTSKLNYIDPRIIFAFSKRNYIPIENLLGKQFSMKHNWAKNVESSFIF